MWKSFSVVAATAAVACLLTSSAATADDIKVSSDGNTAKRITVKVENGTRNLLGRLFNRQGKAAAGAPVAIPVPKVVVVPTVVGSATTPPTEALPEWKPAVRVQVEQK